MKVAGSKWRLLCAAGIKRSNSHDCRKLKFISKAHSPSHWTHASSSWGWSATDECVHVHVYDYIMHIHREIRWQTRQKQRGDKQPRLWCLKDSATFLRSDWRCLTEEIKENDAFNVNHRYLKSPAGLMNNQKHFMHVATSARSILQSMTGWLRSSEPQRHTVCLSWLLNRPPLFITDEQMHGYCFGFYLLTPVYYPILVVVCLSLHHFWLWLIFAAPEIKCTGCRGPRDHWILPIYSETSGKIILLTSYLWVIPLWLWTETILAGQMRLR